MTAMAQQHKLWYAQPATHWLEALPVGNSHLGAMIYGGTDIEEIQLNEETFWSGSPHNNNSTESLEYLPEVRRLIFEGKEGEATKLLDQHFMKGPHGMRFLPLGSLKLSLGHQDVQKYERTLNLGDATATTSYICNGVKYERTVFASQADNVIVVRLTAGKKGALSFGINFTSQLPSKVFTVSEHEGINGQVHELAAVVAPEVERDSAFSGMDTASWQEHLESLKTRICSGWTELCVERICDFCHVSPFERSRYFGNLPDLEQGAGDREQGVDLP
jgi:hypothetical protein